MNEWIGGYFQFVSVECMVTMLLDQFVVLRSYKSSVTLAVCVVLGLLGLPLCTQVNLAELQMGYWVMGSKIEVRPRVAGQNNTCRPGSSSGPSYKAAVNIAVHCQ